VCAPGAAGPRSGKKSLEWHRHNHIDLPYSSCIYRLHSFAARPRGFSSLGHPSTQKRPAAPLRSGVDGGTWAVLVALTVAAAVGAFFSNPQPSGGPRPKAPAAEDHLWDIMSATVLPGRPGTLTPDQEERLRQLWSQIFRVCGVSTDDTGTEAPEPLDTVRSKDRKKSDLAKGDKEKKKRRSFFSRKGKKDADQETLPSGTTPETIVTIKEGEEDKYGQTKHFIDTLASQSPESIRDTIWGMVKHDHPDALVLRFLRARKWDVDKALVMLISTMNWRAKEMHVDDDIMTSGEAAAVDDEKSSDTKKKQLGHDFLSQIRMGKSFVHGMDKEGRPICLVRVRLHRQGEQCEESLERYTVYLIETTRFLLKPPVDTAVRAQTLQSPPICEIVANEMVDHCL
jgi:hypothetical protein